MEVAEANPDTWAVGFMDECWWSRLALPTLNSWREEGSLASHPEVGRQRRSRAEGHLLLRALPAPDRPDVAEVRGWRPVSSITTQFLQWSLKLQALRARRCWFSSGTTPLAHLQRGQALARISQPRSQRGWRRSEDRKLLFAQESPWLNAIEPKWVHGKRKVVEPEIRWELTSSPRGFVGSSIVRITSICPLPKMLPEHALGRPTLPV